MAEILSKTITRELIAAQIADTITTDRYVRVSQELYDDGLYHLEYFDSAADAEKYDADPDTNADLKKSDDAVVVVNSSSSSKVKTIGYPAKRRGDLWTATEANEVKEVVNANADILDGHTSSIKTINETLDATNKQTKENTQNIKTLLADNVKSVWLTQAEYDALVAAHSVDEDTEYNIFEEG